MPRKFDQASEIQGLDYHPTQPGMDVEIFSVSELRRRVGAKSLRHTRRYTFHLLLCVTRGRCTQMVDFERVRCAPGSLLILRPGQVHHLGRSLDWDGWMVLFRPEFLRSRDLQDGAGIRLEGLRGPLVLTDEEMHAVTEAIARMRKDSERTAPSTDLAALLRHQLHALLWRLLVASENKKPSGSHAASSPRFHAFQQLVEMHYVSWRHVSMYARRLGCSDKTLARTVAEATGMGAKAFIASRVCLEAKRLLTHTGHPVTEISAQLGFDEPTNFIKFFRREVGFTPIDFRKKQLRFWK